MHVFQIKGFPGLMLLMLAFVAAILLLFLLPAAFMMVLWNAVVFEGFKGPEIDLYQGFLLWGFVMVMIKLILKPEIKLELHQMPMGKQNTKGNKLSMQAKKEPEEDEQTKDPPSSSTADNQQ